MKREELDELFIEIGKNELEKILEKILEKFEDDIKNLISKYNGNIHFMTKYGTHILLLENKYQNKIFGLFDEIDRIETRQKKFEKIILKK